MKATTLLVVVAVLVAAAMAGEVETLTPEKFVAIQANPAAQVPWMVRFYIPWDADVESSSAAFAAAAAQVDPSVARFGEVRLESVEHFVIADALQVTKFPTVKLLGAERVRPAAPKGAVVSGRPLFVPLEFSGDQNNAAAYVEFVIRHTPTRVVDPISNHLTQHVVAVADTSIVSALARVAPSTAKNGIIFYLPRTFRSDEKTAAATEENLLLASIFSLGQQFNGRTLAFITDEESVAEAFGLTTTKSAAAFKLADVKGSVKDVKTLNTHVVDTPAAASAVFEGHAADADTTEKATASALKSWRMDVTAFATRSPLRKLDTMESFTTEVLQSKQSAQVFYILRESDKFFSQHHNDAIKVAEWSRAIHHTNPLTGEKNLSPLRFDTFWVDGELHPSVPKGLRAKGVPCVGIVLSLQTKGPDGEPREIKGIKYIPPPKGGVMPDAAAVLTLLNNNERLFDTKDMVQFDGKEVTFTADAKPKHRALYTSTNNAYLAVDLKSYDDDEPEADTFVPGKKREVKDEHITGKKKKLSAAAQKKKDAAKAKLAEELARKKAEKEERIRKKKEADEALREKEREEAAKRKEEKKKNPLPKKPKAKKKSKKEAAAAKKAEADRLQKLRDAKPKKTRAEIKKAWAAEGKKVADKFVSTVDGKVVVDRRLD